MHPDFLVIGAQKAGTTWLDRNLRTHPQIWLPPEKEIHYFDLPRPLPFAALLLAPVRAARHWTLARLKRDYAKVKAGEQSMRWYLRYYFAPRTRCWYRSLFTPESGQIAGETTPRYAVLPQGTIRQIKRMMPDLKLIYLLRDPIDRMWSDMAMFHGRRFGGEGLRNSEAESVEEFLFNEEHLAHSCYHANLSRWRQQFDLSKIFLGFQEEIARDPADLLKRIFAFLDVDTSHQPPPPLQRSRINNARYPALPRDIGRRLAAELRKDTIQLQAELESPFVAAWLNRMDNLHSDKRTAEAAAAS
jgi:hypothetical protein